MVPLADCALRMVRLLETPRAIPVLYPAIMREICYWLLTGPHGGEIVKMTMGKSHTRRVLSAIHSLRDRFSETIRIEELASAAQMSPVGVPSPVQVDHVHGRRFSIRSSCVCWRRGG